MSFDAYLVSFGLGRVLVETVGLAPLLAYQVMTVTAIIDAALLWTYFRRPRVATRSVQPSAEEVVHGDVAAGSA
jgi:hypothetical protein